MIVVLLVPSATIVVVVAEIMDVISEAKLPATKVTETEPVMVTVFKVPVIVTDSATVLLTSAE